MFTVTLSKGRGKGEMKRDSHPLARQHSGRWYLFLRFYKPHWQIWNTLRTQNQYSHFGLKAAAEFAGSAWEPGWRGGLSTNSLLLRALRLLVAEARSSTLATPEGSGDCPEVDTMLHPGRCCIVATLCAKTSPGQGQFTWRDVGTPPTWDGQSWAR